MSKHRMNGYLILPGGRTRPVPEGAAAEDWQPRAGGMPDPGHRRISAALSLFGKSNDFSGGALSDTYEKEMQSPCSVRS